MKKITAKELIELGANLGHKTKHSSMEPYICGFNKATFSYVIDVDKSLAMLDYACDLITYLLQEKKYSIVFLGDAKLNHIVVQKHQSCESGYIQKYCGGILTNFHTLLPSINKCKNNYNTISVLRKSIESASEIMKSAVVSMKKQLSILEKEAEKLQFYDGLKNIVSMEKCIFIGCSIVRSKSFIKELSKMNNRLSIDKRSYFIGIGDTDADIHSSLITSNLKFNKDEFEKMQYEGSQYIVPIALNDDKENVVLKIFDYMLFCIKECLSINN